ncbi:hypothetical protein QAD02_013385 [Eretmocerus hayati]|uniref:Uncharacterized protein n=1 Tax=Eretmocerus hayati TaxID=131215 RepID=A0ACC2P3B3_9HYME|nr:hypothetical protein QAD02_013385 [Eretmocerus hayati]
MSERRDSPPPERWDSPPEDRPRRPNQETPERTDPPPSERRNTPPEDNLCRSNRDAGIEVEPMLRHRDGSKRRRRNPHRQLTIEDYMDYEEAEVDRYSPPAGPATLVREERPGPPVSLGSSTPSGGNRAHDAHSGHPRPSSCRAKRAGARSTPRRAAETTTSSSRPLPTNVEEYARRRTPEEVDPAPPARLEEGTHTPTVTRTQTPAQSPIRSQTPEATTPTEQTGAAHPDGYAFMSNGKIESHEGVFSGFRKRFPNLIPVFAMIDMEPAMAEAFKKKFPGIPVYKCFFHHSQAVLDNAQKKGVALAKNNKRDNPVMHNSLKKCIGIVKLPEEAMERGFKFVTEECEEKFRDGEWDWFNEYLRNQ